METVYYPHEREGFSVKSMRYVLILALFALLLAPLTPASAAYGVLFIPESVYEFELPDIANHGPGQDTLDFDPFLADVDGFRSWVHWDTATILSECGGMMDLSYVCAVESEYPEGNYIVRVVAFYRNDAEKSLVSYHITYQTDETEYYIISYFGHHYREQTGNVFKQISLTASDKRKAKEQGISEYDYLQQKIDNYAADETLYKYNRSDKVYLPADETDLQDSSITKYRDRPVYFTPSPDTIYAGTYLNGDIELRNGSGKYMGTAAWFEWDYDSGKVTMSDLANLRRLYSFPTPRVRTRSEALEGGEEYDETMEVDYFDDEYGIEYYEWFDDSDDDYDDEELNFTNLVFFQSKWTERYTTGYETAADMAQDQQGRSLLAALLTVEFSEQQPYMDIDTTQPIFVATMDDMSLVAFATDRGFVQVYLQLDPIATCYGFVSASSPDSMRLDLESSCDQVWVLDEETYFNALIDLASRLAE